MDFLVSIVGPFLGVLLSSLLVPALKHWLDKRGVKKGKKKRCGECRGIINIEARKCRHCGWGGNN